MHYNNTRIKIVHIDGIEIWDADYSGVSEKEYLELMELQVRYSKSKPNEYSFFLMNVEKTPKTMKIMDAAKKAVLDSHGLRAISVIYKVDRLGRILLKIINVTQDKDIYAFDKREDALKFLLEKAKKITKETEGNSVL